MVKKDNPKKKISKKLINSLNRIKNIFNDDSKKLKKTFKSISKLNDNLSNIVETFPNLFQIKGFKNIKNSVETLNTKVINFDNRFSEVMDKFNEKYNEELIVKLNPILDNIREITTSFSKNKNHKGFDKAVNYFEKSIVNFSKGFKNVNNELFEKLKPSLDSFEGATNAINQKINKKEISKINNVIKTITKRNKTKK